MGKTFDVAVIGAGMAGLVATRDLTNQGYSVVLLEARDCIGGRTYRDQAFGGQLELGGGYVHWTQPNIWCELQRHGLTVQPLLEAGRSFWLADGKCHCSRMLARAFPAPRIPRSSTIRIIEHESIADRIDSLNLSAYERDVGIAQLLDAVAVYFGGFFAFFETAGTWAVQGGTKKLADAILAESAAELRLSTPVDAVHDHGRGVIITMPRAIIDRKNPVRSHKIWIRVRGEVEPFAIFSPPGQSPINAARTEKHHEGDTIVLCMCSDADSIDPTDRTAIQTALRRFIPGLEGGWMMHRPGKFTGAGPAIRKPHGNIRFAGSDLSATGPGSIEGALASGAIVARDLSKALTKPCLARCSNRGQRVPCGSLPTGSDGRRHQLRFLGLPGFLSQTEQTSADLSKKPFMRSRRLAKRACDLPPTVEIQGNRLPRPCTMCLLRSADCTVVWLAGRKDRRAPTRKPVGVSSRSQGRSENNSPHRQRESHNLAQVVGTRFNPSVEWQQARRVIAQGRCAQQLNLYLDIVDKPVAACLSQKCMPPCYVLEITALIPLGHATEVSPYFERALSIIRSCWPITEMTSDALSTEPQLFLAVSMLDALFQYPLAHRNDAAISLRDRAIAEAFTWVAIASAAQYTSDNVGPVQPGQSPSHARNLAFAAWHKAREALFQSIGATGSFRLALSLLLFGAILPPQGLEQSPAYAEDAVFAGWEANAPHSPSLPEDCHPVDQLSPEVGRNILELLGSIEWFSWMSCSATILMRPHAGAAPYQDHGYASLKHCSLNGPAHAIPREPTVEDSIIARAQSRQHTVTSLWFQDVLGDVVDLAVNHAGSIVVLLWRSLTLLALLALALQGLMAGAPEYNDFEQHYDAVTTLIASWRSTFGGITPTTLSGLDRLPARVRRCVLFGATDGDLAILLFHKLVRQVQQHLGDRTLLTAHARFHAKLSSAIPYCHEQRLISATHISYLASTNLGVSSPGFQGGRGLKANVQDIDAHLARLLFNISQPSLI
ncbi:hypothetical protein IFM5058_07935 [Aspergillus udagawae]|nr:hypothetical protein IFM5058_07935 [Aspergillus udagawae]